MVLRFVAVLAALLLSGCGGGGGSGPVVVLFQVTAVTPPDSSSDVGVTVQVIVFFSRPVDPATIPGAVEVVAESGDVVPGALSTSALNPNQVRFTPAQDYFAFAEHFVRVFPTLRDQDGAALDRAYEFVFQTEEQGPTLPVQSQVQDRGALLAAGRWFHRMTRLGDGTFLVAGGYLSTGAPHDSAEILDPVAGTSTLLVPGMANPRAGHVQILLDDGRVLLAGGETSDRPDAVRTCEIFDPLTGLFTPAASLGFARSLAHGVLLPNGHVLVSGGQAFDGMNVVTRDDAETYDPVADVWTPVGAAMETARSTHSGGVRPNGDVILVGGTAAPSAIRFSGGAFQAIAPPQFAHFLGAATVLPDGRPFVAGGTGSNGITLFDDGPGFFGAVNPLPEQRVFATATAFADGRVLIVGGFNLGVAPPFVHETVDLFFPIGSTGRIFRVDARLPVPTSHHAAARGPAGAIWITGGLPADAASPARRQVTVVQPE